ncbi:hypothetical protein HDZ31DRAFT_69118 [Schizophyllum fasciatum]
MLATLASCLSPVWLAGAARTTNGVLDLGRTLATSPNPNKVYIGGLPESTRTEDLQNCFGKLGSIVNIELKIGYGFVEFDTAEAALESVNKYHEGYFMGNKIRVEISKGGSKSRHNLEPGACFRCGASGHWARECPTFPGPPPGRRADPIDRARDRDPRDRDYPPPPPREYRRPVTPPYPPPRDYRDYPPAPPRRDYDDYPRRPPPVDYRDPRYPPVDYRYAPPPPVDPYRGYPAPPVADRGERRMGVADHRYAATPMAAPRARTPPRYRDDYDRPPPRDYEPRRGRPVTPPLPPPARYEYAAPPPPRAGGYRRRSESPPAARAAYDSYGGGYSQPPYPRRDYPPRGVAENGGYRR